MEELKTIPMKNDRVECHSCGKQFFREILKRFVLGKREMFFCSKCYRELQKENFGWTRVRSMEL